MSIENQQLIKPEELELKVLERSFFNRKTVEVARDLLGKVLVRQLSDGIIAGKIVEVEAYVGEHDPAAHASAGRTKRTEVLYGEPGHAYIFKIRGYHCLNTVAEEVDSPGCVLVRAVEPILGIEQVKKLRGSKVKREVDLTNGPGKLCQALNIDLGLYGADLASDESPLYICQLPEAEPIDVEISKRIGISKAADWELRFTIKNNTFVSR